MLECLGLALFTSDGVVPTLHVVYCGIVNVSGSGISAVAALVIAGTVAPAVVESCKYRLVLSVGIVRRVTSALFGCDGAEAVYVCLCESGDEVCYGVFVSGAASP